MSQFRAEVGAKQRQRRDDAKGKGRSAFSAKTGSFSPTTARPPHLIERLMILTTASLIDR
jgi:hypothetical protein